MLQIVATMQLFIEPLILRQRRRDPGLGDHGRVPDLPARLLPEATYNGAAALGVIMLLVLAAFSGRVRAADHEGRTGLRHGRTIAGTGLRNAGPSSPRPS
jgi:hypothetical protein